MRDMVTSPSYRHVPTSRLAVLAQRLGKVFASPSTWTRLVRQRGWRRPRARLHPTKPRIGLRTTRRDEAWHVDTTVIDVTSPVATCTSGEVECVSETSTPVATSATATDNCDAELVWTSNARAGYPYGSTTVTYTAPDDADNADSCQATALVIDTTPPSLVLAPMAPVECALGSVYVDPRAFSAGDICLDAALDDAVVVAAPDADTAETGFFDVFYSVDDGHINPNTGEVNSSSDARTVSVVDTTIPAITLCPAPVTVSADDECVGHADLAAEATDVCDPEPVITRAPDQAAWPGLGEHPVSFLASDYTGNDSLVCQTSVTVEDTTPPSIECNAGDITPPDAPISFTAAASAQGTRRWEQEAERSWEIQVVRDS